MLLNLQDYIDLENTLFSGQCFRWQKKGSWYLGVLKGNVLKVRLRGTSLEYFSYPDSESDIEAVVNNYFRLSDDIKKTKKAIINIDQRFLKITEKTNGLRILNQEAWECLISFICSSASNIPRISKTINDMCKLFGKKIKIMKQDFYTFPSVHKLSSVTEQDLKSVGSGYRAKFLLTAAKKIAHDDLNLAWIKSLNYNKAVDALVLSLPGVGYKIADCVLLFSLNKMEAFPVDRWVQRAVNDLYFNSNGLSVTKVRNFGQSKFGQYDGYAQQYLFHYWRLKNIRR